MRRQQLKVLLLESFYGGSHRDVADGLAKHSRHAIDLLTLPARYWKWRMRGASLWFVRQLESTHAADEAGFPYDVIICTTLMDIAALKALLGHDCPPILLYCHETQLAYPQPDHNEADLHFAFTDLVNMTVAERVIFNSASHRRRFLEALPAFLRRLPEFRPMWTTQAIAGRSGVCYPGIATDELPLPADHEAGAPPLVIWNHRWEYDKNPGAFFAALREVMNQGCEFQVAILGEDFNTKPEEFAIARSELGDRVVQYGYAADRKQYSSWLARGTVVVSTAIQENFGISVMEAIAHGCHPILPNRLSYPEIIPSEFHASCLYSDHDGLVSLLLEALGADPVRRADPTLVAHARTFGWDQRVLQFDTLIEETSGSGHE
jgi:glycosyltransferase involved in cell wall biosynthesis